MGLKNRSDRYEDSRSSSKSYYDHDGDRYYDNGVNQHDDYYSNKRPSKFEQSKSRSRSRSRSRSKAGNGDKHNYNDSGSSNSYYYNDGKNVLIDSILTKIWMNQKLILMLSIIKNLFSIKTPMKIADIIVTIIRRLCRMNRPENRHFRMNRREPSCWNNCRFKWTTMNCTINWIICECLIRKFDSSNIEIPVQVEDLRLWNSTMSMMRNPGWINAELILFLLLLVGYSIFIRNHFFDQNINQKDNGHKYTLFISFF